MTVLYSMLILTEKLSVKLRIKLFWVISNKFSELSFQNDDKCILDQAI